MRPAHALFALTLCACASAPAPAPAPAPLLQNAPADAGAPEPECDRRPDMRAAITGVNVHSVSFCLEDRACFELDFASGAYRSIPTPKPAPARATSRTQNATSPDGRFVATVAAPNRVRITDARGGSAPIEHAAKGESLEAIRWVGDSLLLEECHADNPGCEWALVHPRIAGELALGVGGFDQAPLAFHVLGSKWLFVAGAGEIAVVADTSARTIASTIALGPPADGHYGVDAARTAPNEIAIVYGSPYAGRVVRFDLTNAKVVAVYRLACP